MCTSVALYGKPAQNMKREFFLKTKRDLFTQVICIITLSQCHVYKLTNANWSLCPSSDNMLSILSETWIIRALVDTDLACVLHDSLRLSLFRPLSSSGPSRNYQSLEQIILCSPKVLIITNLLQVVGKHSFSETYTKWGILRLSILIFFIKKITKRSGEERNCDKEHECQGSIGLGKWRRGSGRSHWQASESGFMESETRPENDDGKLRLV